jgi:hypothetical protein
MNCHLDRSVAQWRDLRFCGFSRTLKAQSFRAVCGATESRALRHGTSSPRACWKKGLLRCPRPEKRTSAAKAELARTTFSARLKPCPSFENSFLKPSRVEKVPNRAFVKGHLRLSCHGPDTRHELLALFHQSMEGYTHPRIEDRVEMNI